MFPRATMARGAASAAQAEATDQRLVTALVLALQVIEQPPATTNQHQQAATAVKVLGVGFQMLGQGADPLGEQGNLDLRAAGIRGGGGIVLDERRTALHRYRH